MIQRTFLNASDVADLLGLSRRTVIDMAKRGDFGDAVYRIASRNGFRFDRERLNAWIETKRIEAAS